jgi:hypothetical protein
MQGQLKEADELNSKLAALRKRQTALKQAIEFEMVREQKRRERESHRLSLIVGTVMVHEGEQSPDFRGMLTRILEGSDMSDADKNFLVKKGWL